MNPLPRRRRGWLEEPCALESPSDGQVQAEAETDRCRGWKGIEVSLDLPYGYSHALRDAVDPAPMTNTRRGPCQAGLAGVIGRLGRGIPGQDEFPKEIDTPSRRNSSRRNGESMKSGR